MLTTTLSARHSHSDNCGPYYCNLCYWTCFVHVEPPTWALTRPTRQQELGNLLATRPLQPSKLQLSLILLPPPSRLACRHRRRPSPCYPSKTPNLSLTPCRPLSRRRSFAMASKVERIVARLQQKIEDGDYYEAQQQTRVAASRHIKTKNWPAAIDILFNVAQPLLKAGQGGSGGDLCIMMVDVYKQAELKPDGTSRGRLLTCLRLFDGAEPTRKTFITEMIG